MTRTPRPAPGRLVQGLEAPLVRQAQAAQQPQLHYQGSIAKLEAVAPRGHQEHQLQVQEHGPAMEELAPEAGLLCPHRRR